LGSIGSTGTPLKQGFDVFYGYLGNVHAHNYYPPFLWRGDEKEELPNVLGETRRKDGSGEAIKKVKFSNDLFADEAMTFLEQHKDKPFFLYLPFTLPHANNEAKPHGMEVPELGEYEKNADWPDVRKGHAAMVTRLDSYVGRVIDKVKKLGLEQDTLIIFTSDNGPLNEGGYTTELNDSNGPLRGHKRDLYEGGVREPFVARWPGRIKMGVVSDQIVWFPDILPTCAELARVDASKLPKHDGVSLVHALTDTSPPQKQHEFLYWEFYEQGSKQAVRFGDWKAIRMPMLTGKTELYDLKKDMSEEHDVAAQHPDIVAKAEAMMAAAHTEPVKE
jgi:arylsulfatase A-like enzyme